MTSTFLLLAAQAWLIRIALGLLIVAAIVIAAKTRSMHSVLLAAGGVLIALGVGLHYAATPRFVVTDREALVAEARFREPLETVSKVCNIAGALAICVGAVALTMATVQRKA